VPSKKKSPPDHPEKQDADLRAQAAAFREFKLAKPPSGQRALELWMQHAAGLIFFEKVRAAGLATIEPDAPAEVRAAVEQAVDATTYALMMQIDGVSGGLRGAGHELDLSFGVQLVKGQSAVSVMDLRDGDGMCMGYHAWIEGNFGEDPVLAGSRTRKAPARKRRSASPGPRRK
jgi:hypothetical protein